LDDNNALFVEVAPNKPVGKLSLWRSFSGCSTRNSGCTIVAQMLPNRGRLHRFDSEQQRVESGICLNRCCKGSTDGQVKSHEKHPLYRYTCRVLSNRERELAVTVWDSNQVRRFPCLPQNRLQHACKSHRAHARFVLPEIAAEMKHDATRRPTESLPAILVPDPRNRVLLERRHSNHWSAPPGWSGNRPTCRVYAPNG
jgi:hypothetical protein